LTAKKRPGPGLNINMKIAKRGDLHKEFRRWMPALLLYALNRNQIVFRVLLAHLPGCLVVW
jgi:hypothetical protein